MDGILAILLGFALPWSLLWLPTPSGGWTARNTVGFVVHITACAIGFLLIGFFKGKGAL
jgi:hypothetical protein